MADKILILGGTADGRKLAARLHQVGFRVIYSVAGLVRMPNLDCKVVSGGFSQFAEPDAAHPSVAGLVSFIAQHQVSLILDSTHPYALNMSTHVTHAAEQSHIPCWRFHRPAWQAQSGDRWLSFQGWSEMLTALKSRQGTVLLTTGQLTQVELDQLLETVQQANDKASSEADLSEQNQDVIEPLSIVMRTAAPSRVVLPESIHWIKAIGPFDSKHEKALLEQHQVRVVISKNSGGQSTQGKLDAARELGIEVFMLQRPELPPAHKSYTDPDQIFAVLMSQGQRWR